MNTKHKLNIIVWGISTSAFVTAFIAWLQTHNGYVTNLSSYQLFPLFGLTAFSVMWSHYIASVLRQMVGLEKAALSFYFESTSLFVLFAICLHPGLLIWQLWRDGEGLPPGSVYNFVAPGLGWVATLGIVALLLFLAYEFRRLYDQKPWWRFVGYATDIGMLFIFYHGLRLGSILNSSWFRFVWIFYGVTLILALIYIHSKKVRAALSPTKVV